MADPKTALDQLNAAATQQPPQPQSAMGSADPGTSAGPGMPPVIPAPPPPTLTSSSPSPSPATDQGTEDLENQKAGNVDLGIASQKAENPTPPGILGKIGRGVAGAFGASALANPGTTPEAKGQAVMNIFRGIANAGANAFGSPQQKEQAIQREQQQIEQSKIPLQMAQIQNEQEYRRGLLGIGQQKANTAAATEQDKYATADNALGQPLGTERQKELLAQQSEQDKARLSNAHAAQITAQMNGQTHVDDGLAKAAGRPDLAGKDLDNIAYQQQILNPVKAKGFKIQDMGAQGTWAVSPVTGEKVQLSTGSASMGRTQGMMMRTQLPVNDAQGNTIGWVNPQTNTFTSVNDIQGKGPGAPSLAQAEGGNTVIPPKPTPMILSQGQQGAAVSAEIQRIKPEIAALGDKVGAAPGRWSDFWVNKGGINDPDYAKVDQDLTLLSSALAKAHFGGSPPEGIAVGLKKNFGLAQSPADLNARIDSADAWMQGYASRVGAGNKTAPKATAANPNAAQQSTGHKVGDQITQGGRTFTVKAVDKNGKVTDAQ